MEDIAEKFDITPDYLYIIDVDVEESIKRRIASGEPVTFTKRDFLVNYQRKFNEFTKRIDSKFKIESKFYLDTTNLSKDEVAQIVFNQLKTITV